METWESLKEKPLRLPILVIGLNGVPGYSLFRYFDKKFPNAVIGIRPVKRPCVFGENVIAINAEETEKLGALFEKFHFGSVIDAGGNCALKACECDTPRSKLLNYFQGIDAARFAVKYNCDLVRISTDMVFSGRDDREIKRPYLETDPKDPIHNFGIHQAEAEDDIAKIKPDTVMIRIPLPMDYAPGGCAGAIDWITYRFDPGRPATLYTDEFRNPIYGVDLCRTVEFILTHEFPPGIYNCGGKRRVSLYNVAQIINVAGGYSPDLLIGTPRKNAAPIPPRVGDISINSEKLYKLLPPGTIRPWPYSEKLVPTDFNWHRTFNRAGIGSAEDIYKYLVLGEDL